MDVSPEPTVIARTLKDLNQFISSGNKTADSTLGSMGSSRLRLNFTEVGSDTSSMLEEDFSHMPKSRKRQLDSMTGLDVVKRFREKDSEIIEARATITKLEGRIHNMETAAKRARAEMDHELEKFTRKQQRDKELVDDLQHKIKQLQAKEIEIQGTAHRVKKECNSSSWATETKMIQMQQEQLEQCNRLHEEIAALRQQTLYLEREMEEKAAQIELAESHAQDLNHQLMEAQHKLRESGNHKFDAEALRLQLDRSKSKVKELEMQKEEFENFQTKSHTFEAAMQRLPSLEKEIEKLKDDNKFLKETAMNTQLLEEKLTNAQCKIELLESRCQDTALLQAKAESYKEELQKYEKVLSEEFGLPKATAIDLQRQLSKLKQGDQTITEGLAELRASQKSLETSRVSESAQLSALRAKLEKQQQNTQQNALLIKRLQRKLLLVTKERDSLKSILTSYESELTINHSTVSQERIMRMEQQLAAYKQEIQRLEADLDGASRKVGEDNNAPQQRKEDEEKISSLEKKVSDLEKDISKLVEAKETLELRLESRTLKGDYDPTKTKLVHFENNPFAKAVQNRSTEIQRIQEENEALRQRVKLLEEGELHDITQKVGVKVNTDGHSSKEIQDLQDKMNSMETQNKRLIEAFKKKSLEMREVVYRLTGYRVDVTGESQYKLMNMYAESQDDFLMFETKKNELHLLETDYSSTLEDLIDPYLRHENSYPAFLSAVTLDLFNKQTMDAQPASSSEVEEDEEEGEEGEEEEEEEEEEEDDEEGQDAQMPEDEDENNDDDDEIIMLD